MRTRILLLLLLVALLALFVNVKFGNADCVLDCIFQIGTKCVNNECVSVVTPTPIPVPTPVPSITPTPVPLPINEIRLNSVPATQIVAIPIDCSQMDLSKVKVFLVRKQLPPATAFYSTIFYFNPDLTVQYFFARKDVLNRYVFISLSPGEIPKAQFIGLDFNFLTWQDLAFTDFLVSMSCEQLKVSGYYFELGTSDKGDLSDVQGAIFYFK